MATYRLNYAEDGLGLEKRVEFDADSPAHALEIARCEAEGRWAELSVEGRSICRFGREGVGLDHFWIIC